MILHICGRDEWPPTGEYRPESLDTEGFVHCSDFGTVHLPAGTLYAGRTDLVLLVVDPDRLDVPVRWEQAAGVDSANLPWFPHVYGPISENAVVAVHDFPPGPDGTFTLPPALARHRP
jgi:uncharacterized protein (DUF952 family)